ncbi:ATP-binding protein [Paenibacillus chartarius]|uniref:histidine kinase n=1 Tax=Paenibacillus chartarius TaxID=747481 RepID=A0ABV6DEC5_9BACL
MNRERRLFTTLTRTYTLFGLTIILIQATFGFFIKDLVTMGRAPELSAGTLVRSDYENLPYEDVRAAGGTIRILDENGRVMMVKGLEEGGPDAYSETELLQLLEDREDSPYRHTFATFRTEAGQTYTLLVTMPKQGNYVLIYIHAALLLMFFVCVYLFSRWTAKRITGPIEQIVSAIRRMKDGQYHERLNYRSDYEFAQIQEHFNRMAATLERTEREKMEIEEVKQRVLLDLSHDLKTPVTTIQGYAKALQLGMADSPEKLKEYIDIIHNKSRIVASLIEDMFQLAALESPVYPFASEAGDLTELLRRIAIEYYDIFKHRGFHLDIQIPDGPIDIRMNAKLLHRAVANLLTNALQHNPEGTTVILQLEETNRFARMKVCDDGKGIPEELKETLFQPFIRGEPSRRSGDGTGLGLAIAHRAIVLHEGTLRLHETERYTVFEIVLPKC